MIKLSKISRALLAFAMAMTTVSSYATATVHAADFSGSLDSVDSAKANGNVVEVSFNGGAVKGKITFLENGIFRYNVDPSGEFGEYAKVRPGYPNNAKIQAQPDDSDKYSHPNATVSEAGGIITITNGTTSILFDKDTALMTVKAGGKVVMEESAALNFKGSSTVQTLVQHDATSYNNKLAEQYFGGGTQNGRFVHTGQSINIANESKWNDGNVSSPSPFYYTSNGYGVLRNTWQNGVYDFGNSTPGTVTATHNENEFDAYYFVSDQVNSAQANGSTVAQELLKGYFKVTGDPVLLPAYGFYLGHLNAYNRDAWSDTQGTGRWSAWNVKGSGAYNSAGTTQYEQGATGFEISAGQLGETLNGTGPTKYTDQVPAGVTYDRKFSAQAILDRYLDNDMPFGFFLPNDGYGAGYGQNGYNVTGGVNADGSSTAERLEAVALNVANLKVFADYAAGRGIATGLWTQSNLTPDSNPNTKWHLLRDFEKEVKAGVTTLKTDVAWVGPGYSFQLGGVKQAYDIITTMDYDDNRSNTRPNIISLDGWAGSQRYNSVWSGDQTGGSWEYIRFHIPTFIGQSLSGNPNIGSDMDGIWGGSPVIATRDYQWKSFAPQLLDMDGWGSYVKGPFTHGDPYTGVSRMYLKMKAMMMPYVYTNAYAAANIDTGNGDTGLPMIRAMFLEYPEESMAYSKTASQYQYMWGENLLVAPLYKDNNADDMGNDVRNNIYLPGGEDTIWIDYFTGDQYRGGQVLNNFDAPLWKLPLFVKNGAIIPMFAEHNVVDSSADNGLDRSVRLVEFWPEGTTDFNAIEDDGSYIENDLDTSDSEYGSVDNINYGSHVKTKYTSVVEGTKATLTAEKSTGTYAGYEQNKDTTFIVHASKEPTSLEAYNGSTALTEEKVTSKEDFDNATVDAGKFVSFYDATPTVETFAPASETILADMVKDVKVSGKLYVKFANTDTQSNIQKLVINGFENDGKLNSTAENSSLGVPTLTEDEDLKTPTSITLNWNAVADATSYELLVDDEVIYSIIGGATTFTHEDLQHKSAHSYQVRAVNADGHSAWSDKLETESAEDPFLNTPTPKNVTWSGGLYNNQGPNLAFDQLFQVEGSGFHTDSNAIGKSLIVDYGNAYIFDKIEYYPRTDGGNGTVTKMHVETSLDGVNWVDHGDFDFALDATTKTIDLSYPTTSLTAIGARYIKFVPKASRGNFFSASEIKPYTIEGERTAGSAQNPFTVGNISSVGTAAPTVTTFQQMYQKESSAHGSAKNDTWVGEIQEVFGDINFNGISDVYDYAFTAFNVDGGTKKTGKVSGVILLEPNKKEIKAGETFTIDVTAVDVKNLNAFGSIINYNPAKVEYVGVEYLGTGGMYTQGMTGNWVNNDGTAFVNHNAINMGDKPLVSGSKVLSTITMKAKENITLNNVTDTAAADFIIDLDKTTLMGPDFSVINLDTSREPEIPDGPGIEEVVDEYAENDFNITITNEAFPNDPTDGVPNVEKLIQQKSFSNLFNGTKTYVDGSVVEFLWNWSPNYVDGKFPEYVKLPVTFHFDFKTPSDLTQVDLYNRETGNGSINSLEAEIRFEDGTTQKFAGGSYDAKAAKYTFAVSEENAGKKVAGVDITPLTADGTQMLTICEIDFLNIHEAGVAVTGIEADPTNDKELYVGYLEDVKAIITPENATNPYYRVESNDPSVASILTLADENGKPIYKVRGVAAGKATIKLTSAADPSITATYEVTVKEGVNKADLAAAIEKCEAITSEIYTKESYAAFKEALDNAIAVMNDPEATRSEVENATDALLAARDSLVITVSENQLPSSIVSGANGLYSEENVANKMFDEDLSTYWESPWSGPDAKLPQDVVVELDNSYVLEQVSFISHTIQNGGITDYEVAVSIDGKTWLKVTEGHVDAAEYKQNKNVVVNARFNSVAARFIKVTVTGSVGRIAEEDNMYARIAEMQLFGRATAKKADLEKAVEKAEAIDTSKYTKDSVSALKTAIANAKKVLKKETATQDEVNEALAALNKAIKGLVKADEKPSNPDEKPSKPSKPNTDKPGNSDYVDQLVNNKNNVTIVGKFPADVQLIVEDLAADVKAKIIDSIKNKDDVAKYNFEKIFDIYMLRKGVSYTPKGSFTIKIKLDDELLAKRYLGIVYISDDGEATTIPSKIENGYITFKTNHNSYYAIVSSDSPIVNTATSTTMPVSSAPAFILLGAVLIFVTKKMEKVLED